MPVRSLGQEDPLEEKMTTHSSDVAQKIPKTEEPCRLQTIGFQRVGNGWVAEHAYKAESQKFLLKPKESIKKKKKDNTTTTSTSYECLLKFLYNLFYKNSAKKERKDSAGTKFNLEVII